MFDLPTEMKVDRLPIVATQKNVECILNVPKLTRATGKAIADVIYECLEKHNLLNEVEAIGFDTEAANTGMTNGAAACLEKRLGRTLLWLPCRHHIFEIIVKEIFIVKVMNSQTKKPTIEIFETLKNSWKSIDKSKFEPGINDELVMQYFNDDFRDEMINFCSEQLQKNYRDDYRELLELVIIFLGGRIQGGNRLRKPGAMHQARWMAKAIYSLKIFILREQFEFDAGELKGIRDVCIFLVRLYVKVWFSCTTAINAARHDLNFIKEAIAYSSIDEEISQLILKKISNHLWYLSEETIGFAFFDEEVSVADKRKMVAALSDVRTSKRRLASDAVKLKFEFQEKNLHDFVSSKTMKFFDRFDISTEFLSFDPSQWQQREDYKKGFDTCKNVHVINDSAERAVKLFSDYNEKLTRNEEQKQYIPKVVQHYRQIFASHKKSDLESEP